MRLTLCNCLKNYFLNLIASQPMKITQTFPAFRFVISTCLCLWLQPVAKASDYGTSGLIDIPTARFDEDGMFSFGASNDERHRQFHLTYQALPWLQGTFRYSGFNDFFRWDRNYEVKARLWKEDQYLPQVAVGIRDIVGTGIFGSEYLVSNKRLGNTDITLGIGWGRLSGKGVMVNPLKELDDRFSVRTAQTGEGGDFSLGDFFSGPRVGVFGGVSHKLAELPITTMIEYNPDQYEFDVSRGGERPKSPWSFGLSWRALPGMDLRFSFQHGSEVGFGFRSYLNSKADPVRRADDQFISSYFLASSQMPNQINKKRWYDRLLFDIERSGLILVEGSLSQDENHAKLVVGNSSYMIWSDAISRLTALADIHLPASVRSIYFVVEELGHRPITVKVPRPSTSYSHNPRTTLKNIEFLSGRTDSAPQYKTSFVTHKINTTLNLKSRFQLFDPDDPARYQVYADIATEYILSDRWAVRSSIALDLENNFDESNRLQSDSVLPKVRSDIVRYLIEGDSGLEKLILENRDTIGRSIHYRAFGGYLETMYAGIGGELLYWPHKSRLAIGMSLALARQRDFDRGLGLRNYKVFTGHLSAFWATPFHNFDVAIHAGQYLAEDLGATFEVRRTFRNGWQVGVWATLTDVPFEDFGEGSFDKGMFFQIPLDTFFGSKNRNTLSTAIRPIQRDGGQRLENFSGNIFWGLRGSRYDAFVRDRRLLP